MDTTQTITHISLCAGYGGIDLGLRGAIANLRTVAFSEIEAFACANLVAKMEAGLLDCAPIWTDLKTFPWRAFRDRVDILSGGYPCQPFSAAGKRLGTDDPRHLWPYIADGIRLLRPKLCFFENVEGHISLGLREVIGELESMGYKVSWGIFSAREVGAPHQRKRVFILAHLKCEGLERLYKWYTPSEQTQLVGADSGASCQRSAWEGCELANIQSNGLEKQSECCIKPEASGSGIMHSSGIHSRIPTIPGELANTDTRGQSLGINARSGTTQDCGGQGYTLQTSGVWPSRPGQPQHGWEPPRVVANGHRPHSRHGEQRPERTLRDLSGGCGEGVGNADHGRLASGIDAGSGTEADRGGQSDIEQAEPRQAEPALGRDADGTTRGMDYAELCVTCDNRTDELRLLGNGVVPATATLAFQTLLTELLSL